MVNNPGTHLSHCFQGEYKHSCKYGADSECPAYRPPPPSLPEVKQNIKIQIQYYKQLAENPGTYPRGGPKETEALIDRYMARVSAYEEVLEMLKDGLSEPNMSELFGCYDPECYGCNKCEMEN